MQNKSIIELRGIAQSMGIKWGFGDDSATLIQKIETKRDDVIETPKLEPIPLPEDQRLRSKPPAMRTQEEMICGFLRPYMDRGLVIGFSDDGQHWTMRFGEKEDTGTMRQPARNVMKCAERLLA